MLALRHRGARSIRGHHRCVPRGAHVTGRAPATGRGRPHVLARSYHAPDATSADAAAAPDKNPAGRRAEEAAAAAAAALGTGNPHADTITIIREAMAVLKEFQTDPAKFADPRQAAAAGAASAGGGAPPPKYDMRQNKILVGAMQAMRAALQLQAQAKRAHGAANRAVVQTAEATMVAGKSEMDEDPAEPAGAPEKSVASPKQKLQQTQKPPKKKPEPEPKKKQEAESKRRQEAESKKEQEAESKNEQEAESNKKQEAEHKKQEGESKKMQEADSKMKQGAESKKKQEAESKKKQEAESKKKQEAESRMKQEVESKKEQEAKSKKKQEAESKKKQEAEFRKKQEAESKKKQEAESKKKQEAESKKKQEAESRMKQEAESKKEQEVEYKKKQEAESKKKQEPESKMKQDTQEAESKNTQEADPKTKEESEQMADLGALPKPMTRAQRRSEKKAAAKAEKEALKAKKQAAQALKLEKKKAVKAAKAAKMVPIPPDSDAVKLAHIPSISDAVSASIAVAKAIAEARATPKKAAQETNSKKDKKHNLKVETFRADPASALVPIDGGTLPVPLIQYGLDRVLFKEGVYPLQDPRTRVWNFDPYLASIMPVSDFDFDALTQYITSSKDTKLIGITRDQKKKYTGSTSSMTSTLAHFHFLLSQWRPLSHDRLTRGFDLESDDHSGILKAPAATFLHYKDGVYAIDADKEYDDETILTMLGKSMEKLLTVPKIEFEKWHKSRSHELTGEQRGREESYHYTTYGDFMMRSQLDAYDPRLPGTGVYDLKTRAVISIRTDAKRHENGVGYEIRQRDGNWESFEREYYDLIRSAFLKYSLQVRMGRMDGCFVAYHNTQRIFGFQYIPLEEMDSCLHGSSDRTLGDMEFTASLKLFNELLNQAIAKFPKRSLRVHVEARTSEKKLAFLYFFAEPVTNEQIAAVQENKQEAIEAFRERLGLTTREKVDTDVEPAAVESDSTEEEIDVEEAQITEEAEVEVQDEDSEQIWEDMMNVVEETMNRDAEGITAIRDAIQQALEQSGLLRAKSSEEAERYVEALLRSIINLDAEHSPETEFSEKNTDVKPVESEPPPVPKKSIFGRLFSWFGSAPKEAEAPAKEPAPEAAQEEISPVDDAETEDTTGKVDNGPSPELVELLVRLTSRAGTATKGGEKPSGKAQQQELSDDQAKIRTFEQILAEMMPKIIDSTKVDAEADPEAKGDEKGSLSSAVQSDSAATVKGRKVKLPKNHELFGMVVTIRNKVNFMEQERPERLSRGDMWDIEYAMEEIKADKVERLYEATRGRRKLIFDNSKYAGGLSKRQKEVKRYTEAGRSFRQQENMITEGQPVWILGQHEPLPADEVFTGAGAALDPVLPSVEVPRPNRAEYPGEIDYLSAASSLAATPNGRAVVGSLIRSPKARAESQGSSGGEAPIGSLIRNAKAQAESLGGKALVGSLFRSPKFWAGSQGDSGDEPLVGSHIRSAKAGAESQGDSSKHDSVSKDGASGVKDSPRARGEQPGTAAETTDGGTGREHVIEESVSELRKFSENKAKTFKEWREQAKQKC